MKSPSTGDRIGDQFVLIQLQHERDHVGVWEGWQTTLDRPVVLFTFDGSSKRLVAWCRRHAAEEREPRILGCGEHPYPWAAFLGDVGDVSLRPPAR
ncbi:MAG: hypothetical protein U0359_22025 [Byssovorax sp.]